MTPPLPADVAAAFDAMAPDPRTALMAAREAIFDAAKEVDAGPLTECLKWGQPSYLTQASKSGTTIRLGQVNDAPAVLFHCQTTLVEGFRRDFAGAFSYAGNRALILEPDYDTNALALCLGRALTYHRDKGTRS